MIRNPHLLVGAVALLSASQILAQATLTPLTGFGTLGTPGWKQPGGGYTYLGIGSLERGLAYNPQTGNLVLVSRNGGNHVRILDGATGNDIGSFDTTGAAGGTFVVNMVDVAADGAIYVGNLSTSTGAAFKVYRWNDEASSALPPTTAYTNTSALPRTGDSFAVTGAGAATRFAAAGSSASLNGNFLVGTVDGTNTRSAFTSVPGTNTGTSNDYRLGLTFVDADTLIGNQGTTARLTTFDATLATATATLDASIPMGGAARRPLDYAVIQGRQVLAVIDTNSSQVTVFDLANPAAPAVLAQANNTTGALTANANGVGSVCWGAIAGNTATLYAMSTNQGIQAFQFTLAPLASFSPYGTGCDGLVLAANGLPTIGNLAFALEVQNVPTGPLGFVGWGTVPIPGGIDLTPDGMPGCFLYHNLDIGAYAGGFVVGGVSSYPLPIPDTVSLAGASLAAQGASQSVNILPLGIAASNGGVVLVGF